MTADARSLPVEVGDTFDFDSQAGILFVLRAIRSATISNEEKNKLKDLVFLYSTGGKDEAVKKKLADTLASVSITPATVLLEVPKVIDTIVASKNSPVVPGFMGGRPTPVFNAPTAPVSPLAPVKPGAPVTPATEVVEATPALVTPRVEEVVVPVKVAIPEPVAVNTAPIKVEVIPVEKIIPVAPPIPPIPPVVPISPSMVADKPSVPPTNNIEITKKVESPMQATEPLPYVVERMERIRVIKSDINARVGNPVNLGDIDDGLRREYMTALLEAMKLLSTASEQESTAAMTRLEAVYAQVLSILETQATKTGVPVPEPVVISEVPEVLTPVQPAITSVVSDVVRPASMPLIQSVADMVGIATPTQSTNLNPPPTPTPTPIVVSPVSEFVARSKVSEKPAPPSPTGSWETESTVNAHDVNVPMMRKVVVQTGAPVTAPGDNTEVAEVVHSVTPVYTPEVTEAVSNKAPLREITELPTADQVSEREAMSSNPLYTKDVDAGLDQLLGEWAIFKKSGLFGTGPKGREHPLYAKISPLQVPLILSGRFEGSTQEIKQSITDYMNGWRYEQGIIYEANETFDQYLRRVIRHILDLQKVKHRS